MYSRSNSKKRETRRYNTWGPDNVTYTCIILKIYDGFGITCNFERRGTCKTDKVCHIKVTGTNEGVISRGI